MSAENQDQGAGAADADKGQSAWQPRITAFVCRWCTYAGADLAGTSRLKYPPQIRLIKLPCTGSIDPLFLLRAFAMGSDGVLVSGCHPGDCHYTSGNLAARRRWMMFRELLDFVGMDQGRVHFSWVSAAEGAKFVDVVRNVTDAVRALGPFPGFAPSDGALSRGWAARDRGTAAGPTPTGLPDLDLLRADLASGAVKAVLGLRDGRRPGRPRAMWARSPQEIARFTATDGNSPLLPLLVRRLREDPEGVYGIIAGPGRRQAIARLQAEQQIDPERVRVYDRAGAAAATEMPAETPVWQIHGVPGLDVPAAERWAFWTAAFSRCLRCYACRQGCPTCSCVRCVADKTRPRWIDSSATPAGNWIWNVTRAFHQAGRCVECGGCSDACPVGIPLAALTAHLNRAALRAFGPPSPQELRSPLLFGRPGDEAPFIL